MKNEILFKCIYGSHLYGLNTPSSDMDYKSLYAPSFNELLFSRKLKVVDKHTEEEDNTLMPVNLFIQNLAKADIVSIDMIHVPDQFTLTSSDLWQKIRSFRADVYSKNMKGILGYIKTQTAKYSHKIDRYDDLVAFVSYLETLDQRAVLTETDVVQHVILSDYKHVKYVMHRHPGAIPAIEVLGKQHQINATVGYIAGLLKTTLLRYGKRVKQSSIDSGDWKAVSHSYRGLVQLEEIIDTRDIVYPLTKKDEILDIKLGKMQEDQVIDMIDIAYDRIIEKLDKSDLPDVANMSRIENAVTEYYQQSKG